MNRISLLLLAIALLQFQPAFGQTYETVAAGLSLPNGLTLDTDGNLWIAAVGTGNDDGQIVVVTPAGDTHTAVSGLPSTSDPATMETAGAWKAYILGDTLAVLVGETATDGAAVYFFDRSSYTPGDTPFTLAEQIGKIDIGSYVLGQGFTETNPYRVAWMSDGNAYIVDAAANSVLKWEGATDALSIVATFDPIPNTYTPFPPFIDYVPTGIVADPDGGAYVCNLTGFPFVPGIAQVLSLEDNGTYTTFAGNLSQTVELEFDPEGNLYALQFGLFDEMGAPMFGSAKITKITAGGEESTFLEGFGPCGGMTLDGQGGVYVGNLFTGEVSHVTFPSSSREALLPTLAVTATPNPFGGSTEVHFTLEKAAEVHYRVLDQFGRSIAGGALGHLAAGEQSFTLELPQATRGLFFLKVSTEKGSQIIRIVQD
ncbi:MAG: ScyD/ScyE family protein [Saprospiraceae bacterium]|nr:ScyD/ScyE family protein [Saprospiraceae bacterium]